METRAFAPLYKKTVPGTQTGTLVASTSLGATTSAQEVALPVGSYNQIMIANTGAVWASVNFGIAGNVTPATLTLGVRVPPNNFIIVSVATEVTAASVILGSSTATLYFTRGEGVS